MSSPFTPQDALAAAMIVTAAADAEMTIEEGAEISGIIQRAPAFEGFTENRFGQISSVIVEMLGEEDGLDQIMALIEQALPDRLRETAYALACDVAASDGDVALEEMRLLEMMRHGLGIDRLNAAALERGARARHLRV